MTPLVMQVFLVLGPDCVVLAGGCVAFVVAHEALRWLEVRLVVRALTHGYEIGCMGRRWTPRRRVNRFRRRA